MYKQLKKMYIEKKMQSLYWAIELCCKVVEPGWVFFYRRLINSAIVIPLPHYQTYKTLMHTLEFGGSFEIVQRPICSLFSTMVT